MVIIKRQWDKTHYSLLETCKWFSPFQVCTKTLETCYFHSHSGRNCTINQKHGSIEILWKFFQRNSNTECLLNKSIFTEAILKANIDWMDFIFLINVYYCILAVCFMYVHFLNCILYTFGIEKCCSQVWWWYHLLASQIRLAERDKWDFQRKLESQFQSGNSHAMWHSLLTITNYAKILPSRTGDATLPDRLNEFYGRFDRGNTTPVIATAPSFPLPGPFFICEHKVHTIRLCPLCSAFSPTIVSQLTYQYR